MARVYITVEKSIQMTEHIPFPFLAGDGIPRVRVAHSKIIHSITRTI